MQPFRLAYRTQLNLYGSDPYPAAVRHARIWLEKVGRRFSIDLENIDTGVSGFTRLDERLAVQIGADEATGRYHLQVDVGRVSTDPYRVSVSAWRGGEGSVSGTMVASVDFMAESPQKASERAPFPRIVDALVDDPELDFRDAGWPVRAHAATVGAEDVGRLNAFLADPRRASFVMVLLDDEEDRNGVPRYRVENAMLGAVGNLHLVYLDAASAEAFNAERIAGHRIRPGTFCMYPSARHAEQGHANEVPGRITGIMESRKPLAGPAFAYPKSPVVATVRYVCAKGDLEPSVAAPLADILEEAAQAREEREALAALEGELAERQAGLGAEGASGAQGSSSASPGQRAATADSDKAALARAAMARIMAAPRRVPAGESEAAKEAAEAATDARGQARSGAAGAGRAAPSAPAKPVDPKGAMARMAAAARRQKSMEGQVAGEEDDATAPSPSSQVPESPDEAAAPEPSEPSEQSEARESARDRRISFLGSGFAQDVIERLATDIREREAADREAEREAYEATNTVSGLQKRVAELEGRIGDLEKSMALKEAELHQAEAKLKAARRRARDHRAEREAVGFELDTMASELEKAWADLEAKNSDLEEMAQNILWSTDILRQATPAARQLGHDVGEWYARVLAQILPTLDPEPAARASRPESFSAIADLLCSDDGGITLECPEAEWVRYTGDFREIDDIPTNVPAHTVHRVWNYVLALAGYAKAKTEGTATAGLKQYLKDCNIAHAYTDYKARESDTTSDQEALRSKRTFPVDSDVRKVLGRRTDFMQAHFGKGGGGDPVRVHFGEYRLSDGKVRICIGYIGPHLRNSSTN